MVACLGVLVLIRRGARDRRHEEPQPGVPTPSAPPAPPEPVWTAPAVLITVPAGVRPVGRARRTRGRRMRRGIAVVQVPPGGVTARRTRRAGKRLSLAGLACLAILVLVVPGALALDQTFVVNSRGRRDDGTCDGAHCSFREAINAANAARGPRHDRVRDQRRWSAHAHAVLVAADHHTPGDDRRDDRGRTTPGTPLIEFDGTGFLDQRPVVRRRQRRVDRPRHGAHVLAVGDRGRRRRTTLVLEDNYIGISPRRLDGAAEPHRHHLPRRVEPRRRREPDLGEHARRASASRTSRARRCEATGSARTPPAPRHAGTARAASGAASRSPDGDRRVGDRHRRLRGRARAT